MKRAYYILGLLSILIWSCQKDDASLTSNINEDIDGRLAGFFSQFEREAADRNIDIDISELGITAEIINIPEGHVAGQCNYSSQNPNHIIIDSEFFQQSSTLFNEFIIYHELGHCILDRDHKESLFNNGFCTSMMRSGTGSCRDNYTELTRDHYLDELFSEE